MAKTTNRPNDYKLEGRVIKSVTLTSENGKSPRINFKLEGDDFDSFDFKTGEAIKTNKFSMDIANVNLQLGDEIDEFVTANNYLLGGNLPPALISFVLRKAEVNVDRVFKAKGEKRENSNDTYTADIYKSIFVKVITHIDETARTEINKILNRIAEEASKPQKVETTKTTTTFGLIW